VPIGIGPVAGGTTSAFFTPENGRRKKLEWGGQDLDQGANIVIIGKKGGPLDTHLWLIGGLAGPRVSKTFF